MKTVSVVKAKAHKAVFAATMKHVAAVVAAHVKMWPDRGF